MSFHSLALQIISGCWILFAAVWLIAAWWTKASIYREKKSQRLRYSILLVVAYVILVNGGRLPFPMNLRIIPGEDSINFAGILLCVTGLLFSFWARLTLGTNWSGTITLKKEHELIQRGPYRIVRHPIYTGLLAMLIGTVLVLGRVAGLISLVLAFLSFWIKLRDEEELMLKQFPEKYRAYRDRTKQIIPFLL